MSANDRVTIMLNGSAHAIDREQVLGELMASLGYAGKAVAVAINRQVIRAGAWQDHVLAEGDRVEIVRAIGGG